MSWRAFLDGMARCFDLFGTMCEPIELGSVEDDWRAMEQDWLAIARDIDPEGHDELDRR